MRQEDETFDLEVLLAALPLKRQEDRERPRRSLGLGRPRRLRATWRPRRRTSYRTKRTTSTTPSLIWAKRAEHPLLGQSMELIQFTGKTML